ncbi:MAG: diaminopimelate decarboxylase [Alphaproteobacteria bacterium]|nr:diaminopimelate decarboxylase [Alphaproteobacteria bacterium]
MRHIENVDLAEVAEAVGTPFYCYSVAALIRAYTMFGLAVPAGSLIAYSVKANGNLAVLTLLAEMGAGADVVSGGELKKALAAGIPAARIVFSGVGKTKAEMTLALDAGIHQFNVESEQELLALNDVAAATGKSAPVALRINPDVDAKTHAKITTGTSENKFGVPIARARGIYATAATLPGIRVVGVDVHIGSQVTALGPFEAAFARIVDLTKQLRADGHAIERLDLGGGLGVPSDPKSYGKVAARAVAGLDVQLIFEPGRALVAEAGVLVARVIYVKPGEGRTFAILDAGMNDLIRPALYDAHHDVVRVTGTGEGRGVYDLVGPVCESADVFARDYEMPALEAGDLVAFLNAGAYGAVMASAYNARPPAAEVMVQGREWSVVRPRLTDDALIAADRIPHWLGP